MITPLTSYLPDEFFSKLKSIAVRKEFRPQDALNFMMYESGVNPKSIHRTAPASGLFGKMFKTRAEAEAFIEKSAVDQLDDYEKMISNWPTVNKSHAETLYQLNFLPASAIPGDPNYRGTDLNAVLAASNGTGYGGKESLYYKENKSLDRDNDGKITVADLKNTLEYVKRANKFKWNELMDRLGTPEDKVSIIPVPSKETREEVYKKAGLPGLGTGLAIILGAGGYAFYKRKKGKV